MVLVLLLSIGPWYGCRWRASSAPPSSTTSPTNGTGKRPPLPPGKGRSTGLHPLHRTPMSRRRRVPEHPGASSWTRQGRSGGARRRGSRAAGLHENHRGARRRPGVFSSSLAAPLRLARLLGGDRGGQGVSPISITCPGQCRLQRASEHGGSRPHPGRGSPVAFTVDRLHGWAIPFACAEDEPR